MTFSTKPIFRLLGLILFGLLLLLLVYLHIPLRRDLFAVGDEMSLKITDRHGIVLREVLSAEGGRSTWLTYDQVPNTVVTAIVSAEDKRFFLHGGVDWLALGRAAWQNLLARRIVSGASTITQQVIKNRVGLPRTIPGKLREMALAIRLEHTLTKEDIFAQYINRVEFSNLAFGIEAAANVYFQKPAAHLSLAESVFLTGLIQAPSRFNPYRYLDRAQARQQALLGRLREHGRIDETTYRIARAEELRLAPKTAYFKAPHFCEMVLENLPAAPQNARPSPPSEEIRTTLDAYLQDAVEDIVRTRIDDLEDYHVTNAAVLVLNNHTGEILAYVGSKDFFDDEISGQVDGVRALRQPGSTLKPFTYQLALERSYTTATLLPDIPDYPAAPRSVLPENYDRRFHGPVRLRQALACSYNVPAVRVLEAIGVETLYDRLHAYGMASLTELPDFYGPGLTLGNGEVTLWELTHAYSILARRGRDIAVRYQPTASPPAERQQFSPYSSYLITHILADRQAAVPAFGEDTPLKLPFPTAVKTGTSKDYRDNWTVGYTADYTVGVWVGNFDATSMQRVSGISGAAPIYRDVMLHLYRNATPFGLLDDPPPELVRLSICPVSGQPVNADCPHAMEEIFLTGTEPTEPCDIHRAYWVDSRNGLLTEPDAPFAVRKVFVHFPAMYQSWARDMGYPAPPSRVSPLSSTADLATPEQPPQIQIVHPNHGDVYAIDPVLRREFQTVRLSAVVPPGITNVTWYVDDEPWQDVEAPFDGEWPISAGTHRLSIAGLWNGESVRSRDVTVHVIESASSNPKKLDTSSATGYCGAR